MLPIAPQVLADTARACFDAGASMLHMHARTASGAHSLDDHAYREAMEAVLKAVGEELVIRITTESAKNYAPSAQIAVVWEVRPEAAPVGLRQLCVERTGARCGYAQPSAG